MCSDYTVRLINLDQDLIIRAQKSDKMTIKFVIDKLKRISQWQKWTRKKRIAALRVERDKMLQNKLTLDIFEKFLIEKQLIRAREVVTRREKEKN